MSGNGDKLDYGFTPTPRSARVARRENRIDAAEFDALSELYDRAKIDLLCRGEETPRVTLDQLAEALHWTRSASALKKLLGRLRDGGFLSWRIEGRKWYVFRLYPHADGSQLIPSSEGGSVPSSDAAPARTETAFGADDAPERSQFRDDGSTDLVPSSVPFVPSSEPPSNAVDEPFEGVADLGTFPVPQTYSEGKPSSDGRTRFARAREDLSSAEETRDLDLASTDRLFKALGIDTADSNGRPHDDVAMVREAQNVSAPRRFDSEPEWPDKTGLGLEEACLADCQALVDAGHAAWVDDDEATA